MPSPQQPSPDFLSSAHYIVDASSYIFRAYYGIRSGLQSPKGVPTHATFGFAQMLWSLLDKYKPKNVILAWDRPGKGFRHQIFPSYKANRTAPPEDLGIQIENSRKIVELFGIPQVDVEGFEADDIIASFVAQNSEENFVIVTGDKDLLQLVCPRVWCLDTMKEVWGGPERALEKFGVTPEKIWAVQALSGDSVDNIPGAPGIGPKTATDLILAYGSLPRILDEAQQRQKSGELPQNKNDPLKGKRIEALANNRELVELSAKLVKLSAEVPLDKNLLHSTAHPNSEKLKEFLTDLGFQKMIDRLGTSLNPSANSKTNIELNGGIEEAAKPTPLPVTQEKEFKTTLIDSDEKFIQLFEKIKSEALVALDTETFGLDVFDQALMVGLSVCANESEGFYVPLRHTPNSEGESKNISVPTLKKTLSDFFDFRAKLRTKGAVIFQNAKFDLHVFAREGISIPSDLQIEDTMVASYVWDPSEAHGMDALSQKYLEGYAPLKFKEALGDKKNFSEVDLETACFYAAEDAVVTFKLWKVFEKNLKSDPKLWKIYNDLDRPLVGVLFRIEENGVCVDPQELGAQGRQLKKELAEIESKIGDCLKNSGVTLPEDFNLQSTRQVGDILFTQLKLPSSKQKKTGPSTDVSVLEELRTLHPFPGFLLEYRELTKLLSTYIDSIPKLIEPRTGRVHTDFSQTLTATGRLSSSNPNLQNIPIRTDRGKRIRLAFVASPGNLLVGVDYSQIELRLLAEMSGDPDLCEAFAADKDIHKSTAARIFKVPEEKISSEQRSVAKTINFGIIYGQTAFGLSKQLDISRTDAQKFIDAYFATYPGIRAFSEEMIEKARHDEKIFTLTGRTRPLKEINSKNIPLRNFAERSALNSPLQGTAADLIKAAMIRIDSFLLDEMPEARQILQVHDELLFEVPKEKAEELQNKVVKIMEDPDLLKPFTGISFKVPLKVDAQIGENWGCL